MRTTALPRASQARKIHPRCSHGVHGSVHGPAVLLQYSRQPPTASMNHISHKPEELLIAIHAFGNISSKSVDMGTPRTRSTMQPNGCCSCLATTFKTSCDGGRLFLTIAGPNAPTYSTLKNLKASKQERLSSLLSTLRRKRVALQLTCWPVLHCISKGLASLPSPAKGLPQMLAQPTVTPPEEFPAKTPSPGSPAFLGDRRLAAFGETSAEARTLPIACHHLICTASGYIPAVSLVVTRDCRKHDNMVLWMLSVIRHMKIFMVPQRVLRA